MHRVTLKLAGVKEGAKDRRDETDELHRIFGGYFCNQVHCPACGYDSNRFDSFMDLSLEVGNGINSVEKALHHFAQTETLDDGNKWNCPKCKKAVCAKKQMTIRKAPAILTIQLKRFSFSPRPSGGGSGNRAAMLAMMFGGSGGQKLQSHVSFPDVLDVSAALHRNAIKEKAGCLYDLYGVIVHHGSSASSGHYFAFVKAPNSLWYCMNDDSVSKAGWNLVQQQQAYMLFYSRRPTVAVSRVMPPPGEVAKSVAMLPRGAGMEGGRLASAAMPAPTDEVLAVERLAAAQWKPAPLVRSHTPLAFAPSSKLMLLEESRFGPATLLAASAPRPRVESVASAPSCTSIWRDRRRSLASYRVISASTICYPKSSRGSWDCLAIYTAFSNQHYHPSDAVTQDFCEVSGRNGWGTLADNRRAAAKQAKRARLDFLAGGSTTESSSAGSVSESMESDDVVEGRPAKKPRITSVDAPPTGQPPSQAVSVAAPIHTVKVAQKHIKRAKQMEGVTVARPHKGKAFNPTAVASFSGLTDGAGWEQKGWGEAGHWNLSATSSDSLAASPLLLRAATKGAGLAAVGPVRYADEEAAAAMTEGEWSALLDTGKVKKVKSAVTGGDPSLASSFQASFTKQYIETAPLQDGKGYRKGFQPAHAVFYPVTRKS